MRILLTGADGALGTVVADAFRAAGDKVAALHGGLSQDDLEAGRLAAGDLTDAANARKVIGRAAAHLGGFDAVVHLVGGFRWLPVADALLEDWRGLFSANVESAVATLQAALPHLADKGAIVLVGAHSAQPAGAGFGPYGAAKAGVARLTEALAVELKPRGVRVNAILPSIIDTPRNRRDMPDADPTTWTSPAAIADVLRFLTGPQARAISGALIPVTNAA
ncbi:SDR family oxidoreductase [uncultured Caulobacter sp.]|uniref:SDR family oxidoreductase n=1 Tax=uncultured Caulobacter sp. TaxID=158749 RepID=UPI00261199C3|nr:SDR family oxidoreductase [uncultured Caulobacter sp.]